MNGTLDAFVMAASGYFDAAYQFMFKNSDFEPLVVLVTALAIVWAGYEMFWSSSTKETVMEVVKTAIWIVISVSLVFHSNGYWGVIAPLIEKTFFGIAGGFSTLSWGGSYISAADGLVNGVGSAITTVLHLALDGGFLDFMRNFGAVLLTLLFTLLLSAVLLAAIIYLLYYVIALKVTLLLGGFALILGAFKATKPIFNQWVKAIIDYGIGVIVVGIICGMGNEVFKVMLKKFIENKLYTYDALQDNLGINMLIGSVGIAYLLYKSSEMKSAISAGLQTSFVNATGVAGDRRLNNLGKGAGKKPDQPPPPPPPSPPPKEN